MTSARMKELLDSIIDNITIAESASNSIRKLMDIGFTAEELVEDFSWSLTDVQDVEAEFLLEELAELVDIEGNDTLTKSERNRYVEIVKLLQEREVRIPFGISI